MDDEIKILVVEDSEDDYRILIRALQKNGIKAKAIRVDDVQSLSESLIKNNWNLVISDNSLPQLNAPKALEITRKYDTNIPFIIVSGTIGEEAAVDAMRAGANDYILKDNLSRLIPAINRELKEARNRRRTAFVQKKLTQSEEQYKVLAESIKDIFFALDTKFKCTYWNAAAVQKTGISPNDAIGKNFEQLFISLHKKDASQKIEFAFKSGQPQYAQYSYIANQVREYIEMICYPSKNGVSVIIKDISAIKETERNLRRTNLELETLLYRISHDLKGPITSILGLVNLSRQNIPDPPAHFFEMIERSAINLQDKLVDLMNVARIKQGGLALKDENIQNLVDSRINNLKFRPEANGVEFIVTGQTHVQLKTDQHLLDSILQNLIENAIKYKSDSRKSQVHISWFKTGSKLNLIISDNGQGIPEQYQDKIYDMFYRANERSAGSGLGLYIVKNALKKINGSISLESKEGHGATFSLLIPDYENVEETTEKNETHIH